MLANAAGAAAIASTSAWAQDQRDPKVAALVHSTIGIDIHNHVDVALFPDILPQPDFDLAGSMKQSGLSAGCLAFAVDYQKIVEPGDGYKRFLNALDATDAQLKRNGLKRALKVADIRAAHRSGQPIVIQTVEGGHWLEGKVERIEIGYKRGLRHMGLLHDSDAAPPLGDVNAREPVLGGLTKLGEDVIAECNRLGILIDLAHASMGTTEAAIQKSKTPMVFSHTGLNTRLGTDQETAAALLKRLVSKEQARAIADAGGVVGVWAHLAETPEEYGQNIRAMVDVTGIDHVAIGTDSKLTPALGIGGGPGILPNRKSIGGPTSTIWPNEKFGFYYAVVDGLLKAGFTPAEVGKIGGGNYLRVLEAAEKQKV
jgi:membrane dipeptidase